MNRYFGLSIVAAVAAVVVFSISPAASDPSPRYATEPSLYAVAGWHTGVPDIGGRPGVAFVTVPYRADSGTPAELDITTSPSVKAVYRAGVDVPFLGSGYTVESAPSDLVTQVPGREAQIARRGDEAWLQIASYGERRGMLGNGLYGWAAAIFDLALGHSNDYYLLRVVVPTDAASAAAGVQLADTLFPRLVGFYGSTVSQF